MKCIISNVRAHRTRKKVLKEKQFEKNRKWKHFEKQKMEMNQIENGNKLGRKQIEHRQKIDRKQMENRQKRDRKEIEKRQKIAVKEKINSDWKTFFYQTT